MNKNYNLAVVAADHTTILFIGHREACYVYMKTHTNWADIRYINDDGSLGHMSSWVLN
jgi:hypothetical protein